MRVEVLSLCLVAAALSSYFFPAKVQAMSSCMSNGALKQKRSNDDDGNSCESSGILFKKIIISIYYNSDNLR